MFFLHGNFYMVGTGIGRFFLIEESPERFSKTLHGQVGTVDFVEVFTSEIDKLTKNERIN